MSPVDPSRLLEIGTPTDDGAPRQRGGARPTLSPQLAEAPAHREERRPRNRHGAGCISAGGTVSCRELRAAL